jgi:hypothetical protein
MKSDQFEYFARVFQRQKPSDFSENIHAESGEFDPVVRWFLQLSRIVKLDYGNGT